MKEIFDELNGEISDILLNKIIKETENKINFKLNKNITELLFEPLKRDIDAFKHRITLQIILFKLFKKYKIE
jgi:hypothetical protein